MQRTSSHAQMIAAVVREYWARGWLPILFAPLGVVLLPGLIFASLNSVPGHEPLAGSESGVLLHFSFYWMSIFCLGVSIVVALGEPRHRYALPAPSAVLVLPLMACVMGTIFAQHAAVAMTLNAAFDAGWPILWPGLLAMVLMLWCLAILWATSNMRRVQLAAFIASAVVLGYLLIKGTVPTRNAMGWLFTGSSWTFALLGLSMIAWVAIGVLGFNAQRHGAGYGLPQIGEMLLRLVSLPKRRVSRPFSRPMSAQIWLEWMERGFFLPVVTLVIGVIILSIAWRVRVEERPDFLTAASVWFIAPLLPIGILFGDRRRDGSFGSFQASLPLTDRQVAIAVLSNTTLSLLAAAVVWALLTIPLYLLMWEHLKQSQLYRTFEKLTLTVALGRVTLNVLVTWSAIGLIASLVMTARKVFGLTYVSTLGWALILILLGGYLPKEVLEVLTEVLVWTWIALCVAGSAAIFSASWHRGLISARMLALAAVILLTGLAAAYVGHWPEQTSRQLALVCSCALLPLPMAAAPLAVYLRRHG